MEIQVPMEIIENKKFNFKKFKEKTSKIKLEVRNKIFYPTK
jgi:hypothetical protein